MPGYHRRSLRVALASAEAQDTGNSIARATWNVTKDSVLELLIAPIWKRAIARTSVVTLVLTNIVLGLAQNHLHL